MHAVRSASPGTSQERPLFSEPTHCAEESPQLRRRIRVPLRARTGIAAARADAALPNLDLHRPWRAIAARSVTALGALGVERFTARLEDREFRALEAWAEVD